VVVVSFNDMAFAFLGVVSAHGVDADEVSVGSGTPTACRCRRGTDTVPRSPCDHPALM